MSNQQVRRWSVGLLATLALTALGLLYANAALLAATLIPLTYVLYGTVSSLPADRTLVVERTIGAATPEPGAAVEVTFTVENKSDNVLPDVRIIDGVPDELAVTTGTPRLCTSLSPGETRTISYTVVAQRGTYAFEKPIARLRSLAGSEQLTSELDVSGAEELVCVSALGRGPRQTRTTPQTGIVTTDSGGSGLEFHSTRQYRQGDPVNRIDWHHVAKTGEFITVQYREQKTSRTVLILDTRPVNRVTPQSGYPTAADRSIYAAERLYDVLTDAGVETTVAAVGLEDSTDDRIELDPTGIAWAGPGRQTAKPMAVFDAATHARNQVEQQPLSPPQIGLDSPLAWTGETDGAGQETPAAQTDGGERPGGSRATSEPRSGGGEQSEGLRSSSERSSGGGERGDAPRGTSEQRSDGSDETLRLLAGIPADARVILCSPLADNWPVECARSLAGNHELVVVSPDPVGGDQAGQRIVDLHRQLRLRELQRLDASSVDWGVEQPFETALRDAVPTLLSHR